MKHKKQLKVRNHFAYEVKITDTTNPKKSFLALIMLRALDNFMTNIYGHAMIYGRTCTRTTYGYRFVRNHNGSWVRFDNHLYINDPHIVEVIRNKMPKTIKFELKKIEK